MPESVPPDRVATAPGSPARARHALLLVLLCLLAALKSAYNPGLGRNSLDGDFYYQVARHVAEGDGLLTSVSLYHQGFRELPHKTNIYPLWPLMLGFAGRLGMPLLLAATVLPEILYLADLILLYLLANRLFERLRGSPDAAVLRGGRVLVAGHVAVLLLGLNPVFFNYTSLPYTEALAFLFLFASLLAVDRAARSPRAVAWGAAAGALAALAYLTRTQMVMAGIAVVASLALCGRRDPRRLWAAAAATAAAAVVVLPWVVYLAGFVRPFSPLVLLDFGAYRETPEIPAFRGTVPASSLADYLRDRSQGLVAAFDPVYPMSYVAAFGLAAFLVPLAVGHALVSPALLRRLARAADGSAPALVPAAVLAGFLSVAPLQLFHSRLVFEWLFGHREGLPFVLLVLAAFSYLVAHGGRLVRRLALALALVSLLTGGAATAGILATPSGSGLRGAEPELVRWLDGPRPPPVVLTTNAQTLAVFSRARFHWASCGEPAAVTRRLLEHIAIDYILVYPQDVDCAFLGGLEVRVERRFGEPPRQILALVPRDRPAAEAAGRDVRSR
jgi:hypothetical protein